MPKQTNNIDKIISGLDLELYTEVINWKEMQDLQLSYFKSGVPCLDTPQDHVFFASLEAFLLPNLSLSKNELMYLIE